MADTERATKRRRTTTRGGAVDGDAAAAPIFKTLRSGRRIGSKKKGASDEQPDGPTFHGFAGLPVELRMYVWQLAAEAAMKPYHPLRVRIYKGFEQITDSESGSGRKRKTVLRLAAMPDLHRTTRARRSLLQACRESNTEVRRLWNASVSLHRGRTLYFSHTYDIIYFDIYEQTIIPDMYRLQQAGELPSFTADIGHAAFDMVPNYPLWMTGHEDMHPSISMLFCFPRLHSVSLVHYHAFSPEIKWDVKADVRWLLKRSTLHEISFQTFPALEGFDYGQRCAVGNRQSTPYIRHECAICTIHKCAYLIALLRNKPTGHTRPPPLTPDQAKFLTGLRRFMLLAATPSMGKTLPAYRDRCSGWWNQRAVLSGSRLDDSTFPDDSGDDGGVESLLDDDDDDDSSSDGGDDIDMQALDAAMDPHNFDEDDDDDDDEGDDGEDYGDDEDDTGGGGPIGPLDFEFGDFVHDTDDDT